MFVENWIDSTLKKSALSYEKLDVETSFGRTRVLAVNHPERQLQTIIYVPGARTCGVFFDLSNQLQNLRHSCRIYLLDVVGQVGMSDGNCPSLKDASYGRWLDEVCCQLEIEQATFIGASFGGEIIIKLAAAAPERIEKAVLMNPIGFSNISFAPLNFIRTIAPVFFPNRKTVNGFLQNIVFAPHDEIKPETKLRVADFVLNAVKNFHFAGEYPSKMSDAEIRRLTAETHLIVGSRDGLIPSEKTIKRAKELLPNLKSVRVLSEQAHGIEVSSEAIFQLQHILAIPEEII